jgi:hypothetical protein
MNEMMTNQKTVSNQIRNCCLDSASRAEEKIKNGFFGKIKQFNKLKTKLSVSIRGSDDAKILLNCARISVMVRITCSLTCMQPTLHYRRRGFYNVNVIWVACQVSTARTPT